MSTRTGPKRRDGVRPDLASGLSAAFRKTADPFKADPSIQSETPGSGQDTATASGLVRPRVYQWLSEPPQIHSRPTHPSKMRTRAEPKHRDGVQT